MSRTRGFGLGPREGVGSLWLWGWGSAVLLWALAACWLLAHPPQIGSDDALFFLRGLTRFSVLDLSPQFPGYPGFIASGRAVMAGGLDPIHALSAVCAAAALTLPFAGAAIAARNAPSSGGAGLMAFVLLLCQPLGPDLALNLLSDGTGLAVLMIALALLPARSGAGQAFWLAGLAGLVAGGALACRPTYLVMIAAAGVAAFSARPARLWPLLVTGLALSLGTLVVMIIQEPLYFAEGRRFLLGHAQIWGNTALSPDPHGSWWVSLSRHPIPAFGVTAGGLATLSLALRWHHLGAAPRALVAGFWAHALWIALFQNPDNLRHLAPLGVLGLVAVAIRAGQARVGRVAFALVLCAELAGLVLRVNPDPWALAPLAAATQRLEQLERTAKLPPVLITNAGVHTLRARLPMRIYDAHYTADAGLGACLARGQTWRLSLTPPATEDDPQYRFPGRFPAERDLHLYRVAH